MKKSALTLIETLIVMIIVSIILVLSLHALRPNSMREDALYKAGTNMYAQIEFATKQLLAKNSNNYTMTRLKDTSGSEFAITDSGAASKLIAVYKKYLMGIRVTPPTTYTNLTLSGSTKISSFTQGFTTKNGGYFAILLNGNCTTSETIIYDPTRRDVHTQTKSCGLIFFDVNSDEGPNILGTDQYIISIGKYGVK